MSKGEVNNKYKLHKIINIKNIISIQSCFIYFAFLGGTLLPVSHKIKYKQSVSQFVFVVFFLNGVYQNNKTSQGCTRYMQQYCTSFRNILGIRLWFCIQEDGIYILLEKMSSPIKVPFFTGVRRLFYIVSANETSFKDVEDVPTYINDVRI